MESTGKFAHLISALRSVPKLVAKVGRIAKLEVVSKRTAIKYILVILILMNLMDGLLTNALINNDIVREANLLLLGVVGGPRFILIKVIGAFLAALILWDIYRHHSTLGFWTSTALLLIYSGIVVWNMSLLWLV